MAKLLKRLLVSLFALVASALLAEAGFFFLGPPIVRYRRPVFRDMQGRELGPIQDIIHFLSPKADWTRVPPSTQLKPSFRFRMCYDRPKLPHFDADGCVTVTTNSHGFRDEEFPIEKPPGEYRLMAIGDSFTFGVGVRGEDCWPQVLERLLRESHAEPVQVINAGWAWGYNPAMYGEWIPTEGLAYQPDVVIVGFCLNDTSPDVPMTSTIPVNEEPYWGGTRRTPFVVLRRLWKQHRLDRAPRLDWAALVRRVPADWERTQAGLLRIRDACRAAGVRFLVAVFPMLSDLERDYSYRGLHQMVDGFCRDEGIEHVDLMERFLGRNSRSLWVHPTDQHPSPEGHRMLAEGVFEALEGRE